MQASKPETYEEWSKRLRDRWWQLNARQFFSIKVKKRCPTCGRIFTCEDCYISYWLCQASTDWKLKNECDCPICLKKVLTNGNIR